MDATAPSTWIGIDTGGTFTDVVLVDRATKVEWVLDQWPRGYLQPPDVMTVAQWVTED